MPGVDLLSQKRGNPQNWMCREERGNFIINNSFSVISHFGPGTYEFRKVKTNFTKYFVALKSEIVQAARTYEKMS